MTIKSNNQRYALEDVAQFVEWINADIKRRPEHYPQLTVEDRAMWAGFPAQVRAHRYNFAWIDPNQPILEYLKTGYIGPVFPSPREAQE